MWPFVKEAVDRGYVVICPGYRGSTGYGEAFHNAIDYGGYEVDDTSERGRLPERRCPTWTRIALGIMGWSHGGYITLLSVFRDNPLQGGSRHRPGDEPGVPAVLQGAELPAGLRDPEADPGPAVREAGALHRALAALSRRQPQGAAARARGDQRPGRELRGGPADCGRAASRKPDLAETKIYVDPAAVGGERRPRLQPARGSDTLERVDSPAQIDSWNRTWAFFEWHLRPYEDRSKPVTYVDQAPRGQRQ